MFGGRAIRLRECFHVARERRVLSWRRAAGPSPVVARERQVHAPCETKAGNGYKRRGSKQAHRGGVFGHKGARRKRLAESNASGRRVVGHTPNTKNDPSNAN